MNVLGYFCSVKFAARPAAIALLWSAAAAVFATIGPADPALAESEITVGEQTFKFGDVQKEPDGATRSKEEGGEGYRVVNADGTSVLHLHDVQQPDGSTKDLDNIQAGANCDSDSFRKLPPVKECRPDGGELAFFNVTYLEYICKVPPSPRRISVSVEATNEPCKDSDYTADSQRARRFGPLTRKA